MSLLDKIKDIFFGGPDDWQARLRSNISFISPEGNEFTALWRKSPRSLPKKLGVFDYPKIKGSIVQDLDVASTRYSITFYFDGKDNDKQAAAFFQSGKENGQWEITHPVHGLLGLQLVSLEEIDDPTDSGNITTLNSEWIEPIDPVELKTARELAGIVDSLSDDLNISAAQELANKIKEGTESLRKAINTTTQGIQNLSDFALGPLFTTVDALDGAVNAIQDGINDTRNATVLQVRELAGQIQNLIELPLFANGDFSDRVNVYDDFKDSLFDILPGESESAIVGTSKVGERSNSLAVTELALTSCTVANSKIATTSTSLVTRAQAVEAAENLANSFNSIVATLESKQSEFENEDIDNQYFSQTQSYKGASALTTQAIRYLLVFSFDLKVERRFKLEKPRAPIEITISEYGSLGENDSNFDLFVNSNNLKGKDIMLLPAGKEVVIYD